MRVIWVKLIYMSFLGVVLLDVIVLYTIEKKYMCTSDQQSITGKTVVNFQSTVQFMLVQIIQKKYPNLKASMNVERNSHFQVVSSSVISVI